MEKGKKEKMEGGREGGYGGRKEGWEGGRVGGRKEGREKEREGVGEKRKRWSMSPPYFPSSPYKIKAILLDRTTQSLRHGSYRRRMYTFISSHNHSSVNTTDTLYLTD